MTEPKKRVAVLISGRGSNMTALIEAAKAPDYPAEIVGVFANKPDAGGLQTAAGQGIATAWRWHKDYPSRTGFELALSDVLNSGAPTSSRWPVSCACSPRNSPRSGRAG